MGSALGHTRLLQVSYKQTLTELTCARLLQNPASGPGARDASARSGRVRGIPRPPWSPRCQRPFRAGSRYPLAALEPAMPAPVAGGFAVSAVCKTPMYGGSPGSAGADRRLQARGW